MKEGNQINNYLNNGDKVKAKSALSDINVTPLVDVMLVLLIIFMVTAPMMQQGIEVNLPKASKRPMQDSNEEQFILSVTRENEVFLNESKIPLEHLRLKLSQLNASKVIEALFLKADSEVSYGFVIKVMDAVKNAGIETLGMVTEPIEN